MDFRTYRRVRTFIVSLLATALVRAVWADPASPPIEFHVDGGDATTTLTEFSRQAHLQLLFDYNVVKGHTTKPLDGTYQPAEALQRLLANTDLEFDFVNDRTLAVTQKKAPAEGAKVAAVEPKRESPRRLRTRVPASVSDSFANPLDIIRVTGTYIRDEPPIGEEIISLTRQDIEATGAATPADFLRTLPQAFGGGPNQDTHIGDEALTNSGLGVGVNLRGLGARATLVLINGRRVAPSGTEGEYVDIENIPLSAIERVDILPDSASATYGADAVGGVVNFILRDGLDGGETLARGGSGTRGDLQEYLFAQTLVKSWDSGNGLVNFEFYDRDSLPAADRAYAMSDLRRFGGSDFDTSFTNPGNIINPLTGQTWAHSGWAKWHASDCSRPAPGGAESPKPLSRTAERSFRVRNAGRSMPRHTRNCPTQSHSLRMCWPDTARPPEVFGGLGTYAPVPGNQSVLRQSRRRHRPGRGELRLCQRPGPPDRTDRHRHAQCND